MLQSWAFVRLVAIRAVCEPNANSTIAKGYQCDWNTSCRGSQGAPFTRAMYSGTYPARGRQTSVLNGNGCLHDRTSSPTGAVTHSGTHPARGGPFNTWALASADAARGCWARGSYNAKQCVRHLYACAGGWRPTCHQYRQAGRHGVG